LFLENCAGGVHDQLWQKTPVEEMAEIVESICFYLVAFVSFVVLVWFWPFSLLLGVTRVDYLALLGENN